jgi:hypothetical protein
MRKIHTVRPASLKIPPLIRACYPINLVFSCGSREKKTRRSFSYTITTNKFLFLTVLLLCAQCKMKNALLVISNLTWLDGASTLRTQWTSTNAVRPSFIAYWRISRSWIVLSHIFWFFESAQGNPYERPRLTTQGSMDISRSAAGQRKAR